MRKALLLLIIAGMLLPAIGCGKEDLTVVGVMYHHWWVPSRWSDNPRNHPYEPVLGHYDNADANVIRQHVAWAKQYGINTFVLNFWITDRDQWWVDRNTKAVVDILDQEGIKYFFLIDGWFEFLDQPNPPYEIAWRVNARAAPYFDRTGYLKQDDKPVVFFWAASQSNCDVFNAVRAGIEGTSGPIFMTGETRGMRPTRGAALISEWTTTHISRPVAKTITTASSSTRTTCGKTAQARVNLGRRPRSPGMMTTMCGRAIRFLL